MIGWSRVVAVNGFRNQEGARSVTRAENPRDAEDQEEEKKKKRRVRESSMKREREKYARTGLPACFVLDFMF